MDQVIEKMNYREFKRELDSELSRTAEGFVKIGYLLKVARDTDVLRESGYPGVAEFAQAEYGIDKTQVSRFIRINDRFSEGGYGERLEQQYRGFGYAKLSLMLQLPEALTEELTPSYTKAEIQAIKEEADEEKKVSDIELMIESVPDAVREADDPMEKVLISLGEAEPELYGIIHAQAREWGWSIERIKDDMAPDGEHSYSIRVPGAGRSALVLGERVTVTSLRTGGKMESSWNGVMECWQKIMNLEVPAGEDWEKRYGREFPAGAEKKQEVAPVQPARPGKMAKVTKAKKLENTEYMPDSVPEAGGQQSSEAVPEAGEQQSSEAVSEAEGQQPSEDMPEAGGQQPENGWKAKIIREIKILVQRIGGEVARAEWKLVEDHADCIREMAGRLAGYEESENEKADQEERI